MKDEATTAERAPEETLTAETEVEATEETEEALVADVTAPEAADEEIADEVSRRASQAQWQAILLVEDKLTEDGRYIAPGATTWRELPLTLMAMIETSEGGHVGAQIAGRIDRVWREGNLVMGAGVFDDGEYGTEIARLVADKTLTGNSVDLAIIQYEIAPKTDFDENGHRVRETDEELDPMDLLDGNNIAFVVNECVIGMSTVCPFPAFADAEITVTASAMVLQRRGQSAMIVVRKDLPETVVASAEEPTEEVEAEPTDAELDQIEEPEGITASAAGLAPVSPPAEWFSDPDLAELTPLTITEDGRVYGHAADWTSCHIGIPDVCTTAPRSLTNYAYYLLGELVTEEGVEVSVGKITLGTGHAAKHLNRRAAVEHYDNTGSVVADVVVGEDAFGIWVSGALRPDLDVARVRELRASSLSGDWRNVNGHLELVGLLAVNVPGFPIPRPRAIVAAGAEGEPEVLSLVAAGIVSPAPATDEEELQLAALGAIVAADLAA